MDPDPGSPKTCGSDGSGFESGTLLPGSRSKSNTDPDLKQWTRATSHVTGPKTRWPNVDIDDGKAEQIVVPTTNSTCEHGTR